MKDKLFMRKDADKKKLATNSNLLLDVNYNFGYLNENQRVERSFLFFFFFFLQGLINV